MAQTVIGIFNSAAEAQTAASKLIQNGFSPDSVDVSSGGTSHSTTGSTAGSSDYGSANPNPGTPDFTAGYNGTGTSDLSGNTGTGTSGYTSTGTSDGTGATGFGNTGAGSTGTGSSGYGNTGTSEGTGSTGYGNTGSSEMSGTTGITGASGLNETPISASNTDHHESGITRFFKSLFGSDNDDTDRFSRVATGGAIVTVHARSADEAEQVADLLDEYGAVDVDDVYNQNYGSDTIYGHTTTDQYNTAGNMGSDTTVGTTEGSANSIPVIEENLLVGKREVNTGGVRLRSRIVSKPVEESLRLREEFVHVERTPVDRPASTADLDNFQEGTIEMTETAEVPVVSKEARVVEEVSIGKEVEHHDEVIRDTVRNTEVEVEQLRSDNDRTSGSGSSSAL